MNIFWVIVIFLSISLPITLLFILCKLLRYPLCYKCGDNLKVRYTREEKRPLCQVHGPIVPLPICPYCRMNSWVKWNRRKEFWECSSHGFISDFEKGQY